MNTPELQTGRLLLRRFRDEDMEALFLILSDRAANRFLPWFPCKDIEETRRFYSERYSSVYAKPDAYAYAICLRQCGIPIGYINADMDEPYDLGYGLRKEYWNRGIATEAAEAVVERIRSDGLLPYITATHDRNNPGSGEVMKKIGMCYRYSYEEQWQPKDIPVVFRMYQMNFSYPSDWVYMGYWDKADIHFIEKMQNSPINTF